MIPYEKISGYDKNEEGVKMYGLFVIIIISKINSIINHMFVMNVMIFQ